VESNGEACGKEYTLFDGEDNESTQSKFIVQEANSCHGVVVYDQQDIEVFIIPDGLSKTINCWKTYSTIVHAQIVKAKRIWKDEKTSKNGYIQNDLKARLQVNFYELKLRTT